MQFCYLKSWKTFSVFFSKITDHSSMTGLLSQGFQVLLSQNFTASTAVSCLLAINKLNAQAYSELCQISKMKQLQKQFLR